MTEQGAERAVTISALVVAGIYAYRRTTETPGPAGGSLGRALFSDFGRSAPVPVGTFITAWGFTFLMLSIVAAAAPALGGSFAILVAVADALGNGGQVAQDVNSKLGSDPGGKTAAVRSGNTPQTPAPRPATGQGAR